MAYFIYILQSDVDESLYVGHTSNLQNRLIRHNQGRSRYTKSKRPWKLLHFEEFVSRSEAMKRESELKSFRRKDLLLKLIMSAG